MAKAKEPEYVAPVGDDVPTATFAEQGFNLPAPNEDVVKYLGKVNDGIPVAVGVLRQLAASNEAQWNSDEVWHDIDNINLDALGRTDMSRRLVRPAVRPQPPTELTEGVYAGSLLG